MTEPERDLVAEITKRWNGYDRRATTFPAMGDVGDVLYLLERLATAEQERDAAVAREAVLVGRVKDLMAEKSYLFSIMTDLLFGVEDEPPSLAGALINAHVAVANHVTDGEDALDFISPQARALLDAQAERDVLAMKLHTLEEGSHSLRLDWAEAHDEVERLREALEKIAAMRLSDIGCYRVAQRALQPEPPAAQG